MFLGVLIGDALGMPVEIFTPAQIAAKYGRVTAYQKPEVRDGASDLWSAKPAGSYTDDTQLTLAVIDGIVAAKGLDMAEQVKSHLAAYDESVCGWGGTTTAALKNLKNGIHWTSSAPRKNGLGRGNAIPMKIAPVAAYVAAYVMQFPGEKCAAMAPNDIFGFLRAFARMTHCDSEALAAGVAHYRGLLHCLLSGASPLGDAFLTSVCFDRSECPVFYDAMDFALSYRGEDAIEKIGGVGRARFLSLHSVPLAYHCFWRNPNSIESLYSAVNAGGDTDTNASMVGALLGAKHGRSIFPEELVRGLHPASLAQVSAATDSFLELFRDLAPE